MLGADGNYVKQREMSIAFEVDGPYKVPSSPFNLTLTLTLILTPTLTLTLTLTLGHDPAGVDGGGQAAQEALRRLRGGRLARRAQGNPKP
eukprot:scaffold81252_cov33-Phaeocystis_antarctica.AAC.1